MLEQKVSVRRLIVANEDRIELVKKFKRTFETVDGIDVLEHLENKYNKRTYSKGDSHHTAFREGQRSVVLEIKSFILEKLN